MNSQLARVFPIVRDEWRAMVTIEDHAILEKTVYPTYPEADLRNRGYY